MRESPNPEGMALEFGHPGTDGCLFSNLIHRIAMSTLLVGASCVTQNAPTKIGNQIQAYKPISTN